MNAPSDILSKCRHQRRVLVVAHGEWSPMSAVGEKKPRTIKAFTKAWRIATQAAGCPGPIPHDLRRTAVRNLVRSGTPESVAMKMTGHKTRSVFDRYDISSDGDVSVRRTTFQSDRAGWLRV